MRGGQQLGLGARTRSSTQNGLPGGLCKATRMLNFVFFTFK
jgi:hypothetical protein